MKSHDELAEITEKIYDHSEEGMVDIRDQVTRKFSLYNLKAFDD